jgi:hypothetical protein
LPIVFLITNFYFKFFEKPINNIKMPEVGDAVRGYSNALPVYAG